MIKTQTCSICQLEFTGWGNNAEPINAGRCCDDCNKGIVIPARINAMMERDRKSRAQKIAEKLKGADGKVT